MVRSLPSITLLQMAALEDNPKEIKDFSPASFSQNVSCLAIITYGGDEGPYMQMQSGDRATKLQSYGHLAVTYQTPNHNYFETPLLFNGSHHQATKETFALMNLI